MNTNRASISVHSIPGTSTFVIVSAIDNLLTGAAGQALHNMNLMFGLEPETGLPGAWTSLMAEKGEEKVRSQEGRWA